MPDKTKALIKKGKATELSQNIAEVLVSLRLARALSQRDVAEKMGISFQQYQKYEKAKDRLSLEKAILMCDKLGVPLSIFAGNDTATGFAETEQAAFGAAPLAEEEQELLDVYRALPKKSKKDFLDTVRQMAKMAGKN